MTTRGAGSNLWIRFESDFFKKVSLSQKQTVCFWDKRPTVRFFKKETVSFFEKGNSFPAEGCSEKEQDENDNLSNHYEYHSVEQH